MSSILSIAINVFFILLVLTEGIYLYYLLYKNNKTLERGLLSAVGYGATGYLWGGLLFPLVFASIFDNAVIFSTLANTFLFGYYLVNSLINAVFTSLANVWGVFLANQKRRSLYRSSAVGLGYGFINASIMVVLPIQYPNVNRTWDVVVSSGIKMTVAIIFYTYVAMILGEIIEERKWKKVAWIGVLYYGGFHLILQLIGWLQLSNRLPVIISGGINIVVMLVIGFLCFGKIRDKLFADSVKPDCI